MTQTMLKKNKTADNEEIPNNNEIVSLYRKLLIYIKNDYSNGLKLVYDLNTRIYGSSTRVPSTFDPRLIMDNWVNPLTG